MENYAAMLALVLIFGGALFGIFKTKTEGFGRYTTSALVLTLVLFVAGLAYVTGRAEWQVFANLLFAIAGYAGGLVSGKTTPA